MIRWFWIGLGLLAALLAAVHLMLAMGRATPGPGLVVTPLPETKLFVLVVDSLRPEDADSPRLPFLDDLRTSGFRATVDPCLDALTIPCVTEAFSGNADAGLLGAYRNLLGAGGVAASSLFADVVASGRTVAVYDGGQYKAFAKSFTERRRRPGSRFSREEERAVAERFIAAGHDLILFHYPHLDEGSHHNHVGTEGYDRILDELQEDASWIRARLPPEYEFVVVGDHGHTKTGRHIFGLDVPTVVLASGRWFGSGTLPERIPIATYRYLLGVPLGILPPIEYEGADLAGRLAEGSPLAAAAADRAYAGKRTGGGQRLGVLLVALAGVGAAWGATPRAIRWWVAGALATAAWLGFSYAELIPVIHHSGRFAGLKWKVESLALLTAAVAYAITRSSRPARLIAGFLALALPGTVYSYGLFQHLPHLIAIVVLFVLVIPHARTRRDWLFAGFAIAGWWLLFEAQVHNFRIHQFNHPNLFPAPVSTLVWAVMAAAFAGGSTWRRAGCFVVALAGNLAAVEGYPLAVVALAVVGVIVADLRLLPTVAAWATPSFYGSSDSIAIVGCVMLGAGVARLTPESARAWLPGVAAVAVGYLGLAVSTGLRTNDLNFNFAIAWLPGDLHLRWWPIVAAGMALKAAVPVVLVVEAIRRCGADPPLVGPALATGVIRLASTALFVAGFLLTSADPPRYRLVELLEDILAVWFVVAVIQAMAWRWGASSSLSSSSPGLPAPARGEPAVAAAQ